MDSEATEIREGWHWPVKDRGAWEWCFQTWRTLPDTILKHVSDFDICIHAGANVGLYAKEYSKVFKRVLAFEPEPTNFWCLTQNVPERNVAKLNAALGNSHGWCGLHNPDGEINCGGWRTVQSAPTDNGHIVPVLKIDDFCFSGHIGLIHLDVEGYELEALRGACDALFYDSPVVCLETCHAEREPREFLRQFGYEPAEVLEHDTIFRK